MGSGPLRARTRSLPRRGGIFGISRRGRRGRHQQHDLNRHDLEQHDGRRLAERPAAAARHYRHDRAVLLAHARELARRSGRLIRRPPWSTLPARRSRPGHYRPPNLNALKSARTAGRCLFLGAACVNPAHRTRVIGESVNDDENRTTSFEHRARTCLDPGSRIRYP